MPGDQFSHFRDKMSLAQDTMGQFQDDRGHSGMVGNPISLLLINSNSKMILQALSNKFTFW